MAAPADSHGLSGKSQGWDSRQARWLGGLLVIALTAIAFHRVPQLGWTNWDDGLYVYENAAVREGEYADCVRKPINGAFTPLPQVTFALEWQAARPSNPRDLAPATLFHVDNLLLHLASVGLLYVLALGLGLRPIWAGLAALVWGVHPLRVESVAWVTERKDVLYGMFYLLAMVLYLRYQQALRIGWMAGVVACFLLSCLSKVQAVTLPLALLLIDWMVGREWSWRWIWEKAPLLLGSIGFGLYGLGIAAIEEGMPVPEVAPGLVQRLLLGLGSLGIFLERQFVPGDFAAIHAVPSRATVGLVAGAVVAVVAVALAAWGRRRWQGLAFALVFLMVHLLPLVWSLGSNHAFLADRLAYMAATGFWIGLANLAQQLARKGAGKGAGKLGTNRAADVAGATTVRRTKVWTIAGRKTVFLAGTAAAFAGVMLWLTLRLVPVWQDSLRLWNHTIAVDPDAHYIPHINRGFQLQASGQLQAAITDYEYVIQQWPMNPLGYLHRGNARMAMAQYREALGDFDQAVRLYTPEATRLNGPLLLLQAYKGRAAANAATGHMNEAMADFANVLAISPNDGATYRTRASMELQSGNLAAAKADLDRALSLLPDDAASLTLRGQCYLQMQQFAPAIDDLGKAIAERPTDGRLYQLRGAAHQALGHALEAAGDFQQAAQLGQPALPHGQQ